MMMVTVMMMVMVMVGKDLSIRSSSLRGENCQWLRNESKIAVFPKNFHRRVVGYLEVYPGSLESMQFRRCTRIETSQTENEQNCGRRHLLAEVPKLWGQFVTGGAATLLTKNHLQTIMMMIIPDNCTPPYFLGQKKVCQKSA